MHRFRNILVCPATPRDDDPAATTAAAMAARTGAAVTTLHIAPAAAGGGEDPAGVICRRVAEDGFDLVIKTARPEDVPTSRMFSSIASRLLRDCRCPVWIVREPRADRVPRVVAAVDPQRYVHALQLDRGVVDVAAQLAAARGGELHVVTAWQHAGSSLLAHRLPDEEFQAHLRMCEREARIGLDRFLARIDVRVPAARVHLIRGDAPDVIAELAERIDAEIVVVGSAGRSGVRRLVLGNTVEEVLKRTSRALVGVRPPASAA